MNEYVRPLPKLSAFVGKGHEIFALQGEVFPSGSIKAVSVWGMLTHLQNNCDFSRVQTVYSSTSGNTGVAGALMCAELGKQFVAIVDDKLEPAKARRIAENGGKIVRVKGGVQARINLAKNLAASDAGGIDLDQYNNPGALLGHYQISGPIIWNSLQGQVDAVVAAIGTGGTFGGIAAYLTQRNPRITTVPVDAKGSALIDATNEPRIATGIGCAFIPENARRAYRFIRSAPQVVSDEDTFKTARWFSEFEGIGIGGSGGAVVKAVMELARVTDHQRIVAVFHDGAEAYESTVYSDDWLAAHGF